MRPALVRRRGELMYAAGQAAARRDGGRARARHRAGGPGAATRPRGPDGVAVPANLNAPDQTVISGDPAAVDAGRRGLQGARRQAGDSAQGERRVSLAAHGAGGGRPARGARRGARSPTRRFPVIANASGEAVRDRRRRQAPAGRSADRAGAVGGVHADAPRRSRPARRSSRSARATCWPGCSSGSCRAPTTVTLGTADEVEKFLA